MQTLLFISRIAFNWFVVILAGMLIWGSAVGRWRFGVFVVFMAACLMVVVVRSFSHVRRVRLIADRLDADTLANRHLRQVEIPAPAAEAFDIVEAAIRELPFVEMVDSRRDSLQLRARIRRMDPYSSSKTGLRPMADAWGPRVNHVLATITPGERTGTLRLVCEPAGGAWIDWFMVDDGTNLENAEAITRSISRRISDRRKGEEANLRQTETEKELTVAKLSLLHAQVEPHFLYNTLASAQVLTRSDAQKADQMLGNLISYLRHSLPRTEGELSTIGEELERARAYLEIMKIRMGERLSVKIEAIDSVKNTPMPPMMLQTLVENAIKHGIEPVITGGTIWITVRESDGKVSVTVADDGRGFSEEGGGTGVGLQNVRERLRLAYGDAASFSIVSNFPRGVAATVTLPSPRAPQRGNGPGSNFA